MAKERVWLVDFDDVCAPTLEKVHKPAISDVKALLSTSLGKKFNEVDFWFERSLGSAYETLGVDINSLWTFTLGWCSLIWQFEVDGDLWQKSMKILLDQYQVNPGLYPDAREALVKMRCLGGRIIAVSHCEGEQQDKEGWGPFKGRITGVSNLFDQMIFLEPLIFRHKDVIAFGRVINDLEADPACCWLVDDNIGAVIAAGSLGINAVRLNRGQGNWGVYGREDFKGQEVKTLFEFIEIVRRGGDSNPR